MAKKKKANEEPLEKQLWKTADKLRKNIDASQVKWNNEGSFMNDAHQDLKADYILANPPFNDSDWSGDQLRKDGRWQYGVPPTGNANFAWI